MSDNLPTPHMIRRAIEATAPHGGSRSDTVWLGSATHLAGDKKLGSGVVYAMWPPLHIVSEIWAAGGMNADQRATMDAVKAPKAGLLARSGQARGGAAFVALSNEVCVVHALEVDAHHRRRGVGALLLKTASVWALDQGATQIALRAPTENVAAQALFAHVGMDLLAASD
ncbi:MAG: GNAT family N-acetyltransferase [Maritimibacter sp.]